MKLLIIVDDPFEGRALETGFSQKAVETLRVNNIQEARSTYDQYRDELSAILIAGNLLNLESAANFIDAIKRAGFSKPIIATIDALDRQKIIKTGGCTHICLVSTALIEVHRLLMPRG